METIEPRYVSPDGEELIPLTQIEDRVQKRAYWHVFKIIKWYRLWLTTKKGDPCPFCDHPLAEDHSGRWSGTND